MRKLLSGSGPAGAGPTPRVRVMMNIHKELPLSFPGCPPSPTPHPLLHKYRVDNTTHRGTPRGCASRVATVRTEGG